MPAQCHALIYPCAAINRFCSERFMGHGRGLYVQERYSIHGAVVLIYKCRIGFSAKWSLRVRPRPRRTHERRVPAPPPPRRWPTKAMTSLNTVHHPSTRRVRKRTRNSKYRGEFLREPGWNCGMHGGAIWVDTFRQIRLRNNFSSRVFVYSTPPCMVLGHCMADDSSTKSKMFSNGWAPFELIFVSMLYDCCSAIRSCGVKAELSYDLCDCMLYDFSSRINLLVTRFNHVV